MEIGSIQIFLIALTSALFIYTSYFLSKACYDEFEHKDTLKGVALISTFILVTIVCVLLSEFLFLVVFSIYFVMYSLTHFRVFTSKIKMSLSQVFIRKFFRGLSFVLMYITIFINPILIFFIAIFEFFNTSFTQFSLRFEIMCLLGFLLSVGIVLFF